MRLRLWKRKKQEGETKRKKNSLPEVHVGVVEDVRVRVEVVEALRREDHPDVVAAVEERDHLEEELLGRDLSFLVLSFFNFRCGGGVELRGRGTGCGRIFLPLLFFLFRKILSPGRHRRCR